MKLRMLPAALALGSTLLAGNAAAIVVGGVDFGPQGGPPLQQHLETTTVAETVILDDNQEIFAYGQINTVNGLINYTTTPGERLYFYLDNYMSQAFNTVAGVGTVEFRDGRIELFIGPEINLLNQNSPTNVTTIQGYTPWVAVEGHADISPTALANSTLAAEGSLTGATIDFSGAGLLDIVSGFGDPAVQAFLDANTIADFAGGFADIALTTSADNFVPNSFDVADGLCNDPPQVGDWCLQGSADYRGNTVINGPEPSIMALMGMGLLGAGAVSARRRRARKA